MAAKEGRPVVWGLVALIVVSALVAAVAGLGALAGTRVLGFGEGQTPRVRVDDDERLVVPRPRASGRADGDAGDRRPNAEQGRGRPGGDTTRTPPPPPIELQARPRVVSAFERIYLSGSYRRGEGAILQVQRLDAGRWAPFPVTVSVDAGVFDTYVQTSRAGLNRFRVVDSDTGKASNPVTVRVG